MKNKIILFKNDKIGEGELGTIAMNGFIKAITHQDKINLPRQIVCLNRGVLLATENDYIDNKEIIQNLKILQNKGVEILLCETCLKYFKLEEKILVGKISNAVSVMQEMLSNDGVISL